MSVCQPRGREARSILIVLLEDKTPRLPTIKTTLTTRQHDKQVLKHQALKAHNLFNGDVTFASSCFFQLTSGSMSALRRPNGEPTLKALAGEILLNRM